MSLSSWLRRGLKPTTAGRTIRRSRTRGTLVRATLERLEDKIQPTGTIGTPLVLDTATGAEGFTLNQDIAAFSDTVPDPIGQYSAVINWGDGTITSGSVSFNTHDDGLYYVFGSHEYTAPGTFPVKVTLYDGPVGGGSTSSATSTGGPITVTPVNDPPIANGEDLGTIFEDSGPHTYSFGGLLANDLPGPQGESDEDAQALTITTFSNVTGGTAFIDSATNSIIFTPTADYSGPAGFDYTIRDNGLTNGVADFKSATAHASLTVAAVNDPPVANDDVLSSVAEDAAAFSIPFSTLLTNDSPGPANESGQSLTITAVSGATGGTVAINGTNVVFTPAADYNGPAKFTYTVRDNGQTNGADDFKTATASAFFVITPVNDPPVAQNDTPSVTQGVATFTIPFSALLGNDSKGPADESGQTLTVVGVSNAVGGTAVLQSGGVLFTRAANFSGPASFSYTVQDNGATGGVADPKTATAVAGFSLDALPAISLGPTTLLHATAGAVYGQTLSASGGGGGPFTFAVTAGALPAGITLSSGGVLSGSSTVAMTASFTVTATGAGIGFSGSRAYSLTVDPAAAATFTVSAFPSPATAGVAGSFTVTARDAYGNVATGYAGTVHFSSSDSQAALPADATLSNGAGSFSATLKTAGTQALTATDTANGGLTGSQTGIVVNPAAASTLVVAGFPSPVTAGVAGLFTVTARDAFGNATPAYSGTVHFSSSDPQAVLPANATLSGGAGTFIATLKTAGPQSLTAADTGNAALAGSQAGIVVNPGAATHFVIVGPPSVTKDTAFSITVKAVDAFGNVATGYRGTVKFGSSDKHDDLPDAYTFTAADNGVHTFTGLSLHKRGRRTITVSDAGTATILGGLDIDVL
jgi:hypothetical protein